MSINTPSLPSDHRTELVVQFLAELMKATMNHQDQSAFQQALQTYCDSLHPWLEPSDGPSNPRAVFSLFEHSEFDDHREQISVVLSPEAEALFRAWLRRNKILHDGGFNTAHAWSN